LNLHAPRPPTRGLIRYSGTADTLPYSCYKNASEQAVTLQYETNVNASNVAVGEAWVSAGNAAGACAVNMVAAPYVGTAATARDHMSVVDALGEDGLLHYYGMMTRAM
jgi:hypothetical protein